ncbi:MAG: hypothetical protein QM737_18660 [Ferruginibacter sp.]
MNEITYLFGAGASCQSMPLVSNFPLRFKLFQETIFYIGNIPPDLANEITDFGKKVESHSSFDTFFKKLFHQNKSNELIIKYKRILFLYLLFEHLVNHETIKDRSLFKKLEGNNLHRKYPLDPRYEALIAGLLKPVRGKADFIVNVNFLTWNYDANLLYALNSFIAPEEPFYEFITKRKSGNFFQISEQIKLFHLNGHIYHEMLNQYNSDNSFFEFENLLYSDFKDFANDCIKFAWEQEIDKKGIQECIKKSKSIIITGYSLPLYNRAIDSIILNSQGLYNRNLFIQDLNATGIAKLLDSDFNIRNQSLGDPIITLTENCSSFVVPNSIF